MVITTSIIILLAIFITLVFTIIHFSNNFLDFLKNKNQLDSIINFASYLAILSYYMEKSYDIIHKSDVLVYSIDGLRLTEEDEEKAVKEYTKLVLKFLGSTMKDELVNNIYGDEETLIFNIVEYFTDRYANDEIRESSMNSVMNNEEGEMNGALEQIIRSNSGNM